MKKRIIELILIIFSLFIITSCEKEKPNEIEYLDNMTFGRYPQSLVTDTNIIKELTKIQTFNNLGYIEYNNEEYVNKNNSYYKVEPIEWEAVKMDGKIYLYSTKILDSVVFNSDEYFKTDIYAYLTKPGVPENTKANTYQYSDLRTWLNSTFYNKAFSDTEQNKMVKYEYDGLSDAVYTLCEKDFELSIQRALKPTDYIKKDVDTYNSTKDKIEFNGYAPYWLRDANSYCPYQVYGMNYDGLIYNYVDCYYIYIGVRPVIVIND